jgi:hypothetical protein
VHRVAEGGESEATYGRLASVERMRPGGAS